MYANLNFANVLKITVITKIKRLIKFPPCGKYAYRLLRQKHFKKIAYGGCVQGRMVILYSGKYITNIL